MTSKTAFDKFKLRFNKLDTNFNFDLNSVKFCELFNKAQYMYISKLLETEDANKDIQRTLQSLLKDAEITGIQDDNKFIFDLPDNWFWVKRVTAVVKGKTCTSYLNCLPVAESNIGRLLQNENWKPSVEWEETIYSVGDGKLRIYVDNFRIIQAKVVYYREPVKIDIKSGDNNIYGLPSQDIDPEWNDSVVEDIIDLAVIIASSDVTDVNNFQSKLQLKQLA